MSRLSNEPSWDAGVSAALGREKGRGRGLGPHRPGEVGEETREASREAACFPGRLCCCGQSCSVWDVCDHEPAFTSADNWTCAELHGFQSPRYIPTPGICPLLGELRAGTTHTAFSFWHEKSFSVIIHPQFPDGARGKQSACECGF